MPVSKQSVSLPSPVLAALKLRDESNLSGAISRTVMRYLAVLAYERRELRPKFSPAECGLILDACNGVAFFDSFSVRLFPEGVRDAIEMEELDAKWQVDGPALLAKLDATTFSQRMAFVDAVQRWWNRTTEPGEPPQYGELLADPTPDREIGQIY